MFIKVTKEVAATPVYININSIESIEQDGNTTIIVTNNDKWYYVKESADDVIRMINCTNMLSVS